MAAITANGTTVSVSGTAIGNLLSVSPTSLSVATIDSTSMDDSWRTFIGGLKDGGECTFEISYDPSLASHTSLESYIDGDNHVILITWSDETTCTFNAIITSFSPSANIDDKLNCSVGLKITGAVTL